MPATVRWSHHLPKGAVARRRRRDPEATDLPLGPRTCIMGKERPRGHSGGAWRTAARPRGQDTARCRPTSPGSTTGPFHQGRHQDKAGAGAPKTSRPAQGRRRNQGRRRGAEDKEGPCQGQLHCGAGVLTAAIKGPSKGRLCKSTCPVSGRNVKGKNGKAQGYRRRPSRSAGRWMQGVLGKGTGCKECVALERRSGYDCWDCWMVQSMPLGLLVHSCHDE